MPHEEISSRAPDTMRLIKKWICFLVLLISMEASSSEELVFWNVGQGQWSTYVSKDQCIHFDMGGERAPLKRIKNICGQKEQQILFLSHYDWDHRSFVYDFSRDQRICLGNHPLAPSQKKKIKLPIAPCSREAFSRVQLIFQGEKNKKSNSTSQVFIEPRFLALFPGDSTTSEEKIWGKKDLSKIKILAVGHHGSKTSTSKFLISQLKNIKLAIASSRYQKYGHPHKEVRARLESNRIPLLSTEDWGNIRYRGQ